MSWAKKGYLQQHAQRLHASHLTTRAAFFQVRAAYTEELAQLECFEVGLHK